MRTECSCRVNEALLGCLKPDRFATALRAAHCFAIFGFTVRCPTVARPGAGRCAWGAGSSVGDGYATASGRPRLTREDVLDGGRVADLLGLPVSTVLEYARRGLLPGHKLGRRWVFLRDEVEAAVRGERPAARRQDRSRI
jgi:excisionase family DNA binding protein